MAVDPGKDWTYRMAATLVMDVRRDCHTVDERELIARAWEALKEVHNGEGHTARFEATNYVEEVSRAIRDIGTGRRDRMPHPGAAQKLRRRLHLPEK